MTIFKWRRGAAIAFGVFALFASSSTVAVAGDDSVALIALYYHADW